MGKSTNTAKKAGTKRPVAVVAGDDAESFPRGGASQNEHEKAKRIKTKHEKDGPKRSEAADALKFKDMHPGSLVLGVISEIHTSELVLSLPYNMYGYVQKDFALDFPDLESNDVKINEKNYDLDVLYSVGDIVPAVVMQQDGHALRTLFHLF